MPQPFERIFFFKGIIQYLHPFNESTALLREKKRGLKSVITSQTHLLRFITRNMLIMVKIILLCEYLSDRWCDLQFSRGKKSMGEGVVRRDLRWVRRFLCNLWDPLLGTGVATPRAFLFSIESAEPGRTRDAARGRAQNHQDRVDEWVKRRYNIFRTSSSSFFANLLMIPKVFLLISTLLGLFHFVKLYFGSIFILYSVEWINIWR